jgi:formyltetrahydrofolate deformylase
MGEWYDLPFFYFPVSQHDKAAQEAQIIKLATETEAELVVLARYMQIVSPSFCEFFNGRLINIHHSFLPSFKGAKPYHQAFERGVKIIGATSHYVTSDLDEGPIIAQETTPVTHAHTPEDLVRLGQDVENRVLAKAIKLHVEKRVFLNGHKTIIFD